ncbi:MAG: HD domain-containing protein [Lachnospiraceae bacterium]|nr:HD domain-containing protein [Lachnospiraceae bacterium]
MQKNPIDTTQYSNRIQALGEPLFKTAIFEKGRLQKHHQATVVSHTMRVTRRAEIIAEFLKRHNINVNVDDVVIAALCHDIGIIGRKKKYKNNLECCKRHSSDSVIEARKIYGNLSAVAEEAILYHMWPLSVSYPKSTEGWVVLAADKLSSIKGVFTKQA